MDRNRYGNRQRVLPGGTDNTPNTTGSTACAFEIGPGVSLLIILEYSSPRTASASTN